MSNTPKHAPDAAAGDDRNLVHVDENYLAPSFEDRLRIFWEKNSRSILAACALVLVVILGKGAYQFYESSRAKAAAADYAAATTDDQLNAFIADHAGDPLAGLAQLRLADKEYKAGDYAAASEAYHKAVSILKKDTFGERARLGAAMSAILAGSESEGTSALKQIVDDISLSKRVRSEAAYHLAMLAAGADNTAEAIRFIEQTTTIDAEGQWADRASLLRSTLSAVAASPTAPTIELPAVKFN